MQIADLAWYPLDLPRKEPFATSRQSSDVARVVFVRLDADGFEGWGAASPGEATGETVDTVVAALKRMAKGLRGFAFERPRELADGLDAILPRNPSAKAAVDMAAYDALGKSRGQPVHRFIGVARDSVLTDRTVSLLDPPKVVEKAREFVAQGFRAIKVKLEGHVERDVLRVSALREVLGRHILLRADANQAFRYRQALRFARQAYPCVVEFFEQPLAADDLRGMSRLTEASPMPVMADESVLSPQDAAKAAQERCARLVNLKLMKTGGISRAIEANAICQSASMPTMIGCNAESSLSIAAALHFAMGQPNVRFADLDSHFNLAKDPAEGLVFDDGYLKVSGRPGLGVSVDL